MPEITVEFDPVALAAAQRMTRSDTPEEGIQEAVRRFIEAFRKRADELGRSSIAAHLIDEEHDRSLRA